MLPVLPVMITAELMDGVSSDYSHVHSACHIPAPSPELKIIVLLN